MIQLLLTAPAPYAWRLLPSYVIVPCESCGGRECQWRVRCGDDGEQFRVCSPCLPVDVEFSRHGDTGR